jgi:predicted nucleic acid-binding protein
VLHEALWRGADSSDLTEATRDRLFAGPISRNEPPKLYTEAWHVAEELGWAKTYDAEYVALARLLDCRLLTVDRRLHRGAGRLVEVIGPSDL